MFVPIKYFKIPLLQRFGRKQNNKIQKYTLF